MRNVIIITTFLGLLFGTKLAAQNTFESQAKQIARKIEAITTTKKTALKIEVEAINVQFANKSITLAAADESKQKLAQATATAIENEVAPLQLELKNLVQNLVDGKIKERDTNNIYVDIGKSELKFKKHTNSNRRTTSQLVFAAGLNNLVTNGTTDRSDFRYWGSHFYELGLSWNSRIAKNNNLLHFKYGFSFMQNNLRPSNNREFVVNGNQTTLATSPIHLSDSRFRNVYLVVPLHLEFDFSGSKSKKDGKKYFTTHEGFRMGLGGYAGVNIDSKQFSEFDQNGYDTEREVDGDFNTTDFIYGLSTYIGYSQTSLYVKYDLNPIFTDNVVKQNNVSLGIRFDFN